MSRRNDLIGKKIDKLTILSPAGEKKDKRNYTHWYWNCLCDCGNEVVKDQHGLLYDKRHSCGCLKHGKILTGLRFGNLTVIEEADPVIRKDRLSVKKRWLCRCDCGNLHTVTHELLISGNVKSCGCMRYKGHKNPNSVTVKYSRLYRIYRGIMNRCNNPQDQHHLYYYDRGIKICDEWKGKFNAFLEWSLSHGYDDNLSIDRINNDGDYSPDNCRWVTNIEQQYNRRCTLKYTIHGKVYNLKEIEETFKIKRVTFYARVTQWGMTPEQAIVKNDLRKNMKNRIIDEP